MPETSGVWRWRHPGRARVNVWLQGGGGAGKGLRGLEGSRVSCASGRGLGRRGGCLGCQTGPGQRRGQGMSGGGEAQRPGSLGDLGFQAPAPSSQTREPTPSPFPDSSIRRLPGTRASGPPACSPLAPGGPHRSPTPSESRELRAPAPPPRIADASVLHLAHPGVRGPFASLHVAARTEGALLPWNPGVPAFPLASAGVQPSRG